MGFQGPNLCSILGSCWIFRPFPGGKNKMDRIFFQITSCSDDGTGWYGHNSADGFLVVMFQHVESILEQSSLHISDKYMT